MSALPKEKANKKPKGVKKTVAKKLSNPAEAELIIADIVIESETELCPYDENLLERARNQWQFGDWENLAQLSRDTLQHHPDRAKLALMAAAGHLQQGDSSAARQFTRLAQEWGCGEKLISQILIAGVHNTLARAAAVSGQGHRALEHFEAAITAGAPGSDRVLLSQARIGKQLEQLGLPDTGNLHPTICAESVLRPPSLSEIMLAFREQIKEQNNEIIAQIKNQQSDLLKMRKFLESTVKNEVLNATKQLEAFLGVQHYLQSGELIGNMHNWPISPDFAFYLIQLLETNDYDLVIEFGSGTSTILIAKTLAKATARRQGRGRSPVRQVAFEHLEKYHSQTLAKLRQAGLAEAVQLVHTPLVPFNAPNGNAYPYYDCHRTLADLAQGLPSAGFRLLVMVDGPPGSTGKHARYPAIPAILAHFVGAQIDILLDDYIRNDEKEIAQLWLADIEGHGLRYTLSEMKMEKDACLITIAD